MNEHTSRLHSAGIVPGCGGLPPLSPLGWSVWTRLTLALAACLVLWAVVLWALD